MAESQTGQQSYGFTYTTPAGQSWWSEYQYPYYNWWYPTVTQRTYKCPCGGEFFNPVQKKRTVNNEEQVYHVCPFCDAEMKGLTQ